MLDGKHVVYTPILRCRDTGREGEVLRGDIPEEPDLMTIMNQPSMDFVPVLGKGRLLLYNSSLIDGEPQRSDIKRIAVPATEIADSLGKELSPTILGDVKDTGFSANSMMFGAYFGTAAVQTASKYLKETREHFLAGKKSGLLELNQLAVERVFGTMSVAKW